MSYYTREEYEIWYKVTAQMVREDMMDYCDNQLCTGYSDEWDEDKANTMVDKIEAMSDEQIMQYRSNELHSAYYDWDAFNYAMRKIVDEWK